MKKIISTILLLFTVFACTNDFESLNKNIKQPESGSVPAATLLTSAEKSLCDEITTPDVNNNIFRLLIQYWTETTYTQESRYDLTTRNIPRNFWNAIYRDVLTDLKEAARLVTLDGTINDEGVRANQLAITELLEVYTFSVLVDTYGDIPYTEALDYTNPTPKYDDAATIYDDLIVRIDNALASITVSKGSFSDGELIYGGSMGKWAKFGNTLKLRLGMRLADVGDGSKAKAIVEAAAPNVFSSNSDNALFYYLGDFPNSSSLYNELIYQNRYDFVSTETIIDVMDTLNDPRISTYFSLAQSDTTIYIGGINGAVSNDFASYAAPSFYDCYLNANVLVNGSTVQKFPTNLLDYAETEFYLAEAVERGFAVGGTAETHYNNAVGASIVDWGGSTSDVTAYLANPLVAYTTATGDFKAKIGLQKWLALYNRGFEAWAEYRRLDAPTLKVIPSPPYPFPLRFTYPDTEQTLNPTGWQGAAGKMGGDLVTNKVFWDKN